MSSLTQLADVLEAERPLILQRWRARSVADPQINASPKLSSSQFNDHIPILLGTFCQRLREGETSEQDEEERELSEAHGRHRWQQGYDLRGMVREWGHLNATLVGWFAEQEASGEARVAWAEFVRDNETLAIALYEQLLQSEATAKLRDLEEALEHVRSLERERGEILRQASHDLRGWLSIVASASNLLGHEGFPEEERERVGDLLLQGVKNLAGMMTDLLDMARLEAGQERREERAFNAGELFEGACSSWREVARQKGLELKSSGPPSLWVEGDSAKVQRIAQNLVLNAIKYTSQGHVCVSWDEEDELHYFLEIADTGQGLEGSNAAPLAATLQEQKMDSSAPASGKTFQNEPSNDRNAAPTGEGIGLSIVRRLCELLEATIHLRSSNVGSTFRVVFPKSYEG